MEKVSFEGNFYIRAGNGWELGLTFDSAPDTLSQHRANFRTKQFAARNC